MTAVSAVRLLSEPALLVLTIACTHGAVSGSQTMLHYWLGHRRLGGLFFRNHINFHHTTYARGHLASASYEGQDGNNTPFFLIPTVVVGAGAFLLLPLALFLAMAMTAAASFYLHVWFDRPTTCRDVGCIAMPGSDTCNSFTSFITCTPTAILR